VKEADPGVKHYFRRGKMKYSNLDVLRSVAIITVLIDHLIPTLHTELGFGTPFILGFTAHIGQAGVLAFFVHTSIVLMMSLERLQEQASAITLRFYLRRAFRIFPLSWVIIAGVLLLGLPSNTWRAPDEISLPVILANVSLIQNIWTKKQVIQPLWSLAYEMQMYLILPILFSLIQKQKGRKLMFVLLIICSAGGYCLAQKTGGRLNMAAYLPCFVAGVWSFGLRKVTIPRLSSMLWLPLVIGLVLVYAWLHKTEPEPVYWQGWIYCTILGALIPLFLNIQSRSLKWICNQIARYSYGMYLLHVPVLYLVFRFLQVADSAVGSVLFFTLTLLGSITVYYLVEEPLIELGRRLSEPKNRLGDRIRAVVAKT